jgi:chemotaxis protein methyltransferase CheR
MDGVAASGSAGELGLDPDELAGLLGLVERQTGIDYQRFQPDFLAGRVAAHLAAERLESVAELRRRLDTHSPAMTRLLVALSIRPPGLFPEARLVTLLRRDVCPRLRTYPRIRIWHAGCATGEDVYATAIVLREEGLLSRALIYGTDLSEAVLARARTGLHTGSLATATECYHASGGLSTLQEYYQPVGDHWVARPLLRDHIVFAEHALGSDGSFNEFHLIVTRGVLARMTASFQTHAQQVIQESLCMFGFLFVGDDDPVEQTPLRAALSPLADGGSFYRRVR